MKIIETIEKFIPGDWGEENYSEATPCKVVCVRGADIVPIDNSDFGHIPTRYISQQSFDTKCLQAGDIVVEKSGGSPTQSTGRVAYISQELIDAVGPVVCSNFCIAFRAKEKWNPLYVFYYLQYVYNCRVFFNFEGKTSGLKNLQLEAAYKSVPIEDVDKAYQDKVVAILDGIHRKMTVNRQINQNLEALAKQLYDYWFVQFDFPNEEGKPYKSSGGKMVWNEKIKREIPEGWDAIPLSQIMDYEGGSQPPASKFIYQMQEGYVRFVQIRDYYSDSYITYIPIRKSNKLCTETDIMIARYGASLGRVCYGLDGAYNVALAKVTPKEKGYTEFLRTYLMSTSFYDKINSIGLRAAQAGFNRDDIENILIPFPVEDSVISHFQEKIESNFLTRLHNDKENKILIKQRDELLPLLMNGQVSLSDFN